MTLKQVSLLLSLSPLLSLCLPSQYLTYDGDIMLGGLFPIHKRGDQGEACGAIQDEDGIQPLEALLFTLDEINNDDTILPGVNYDEDSKTKIYLKVSNWE